MRKTQRLRVSRKNITANVQLQRRWASNENPITYVALWRIIRYPMIT